MFKQIAGSLGAIFASLCCLGFAPVLAALAAAGLGFIINDAVLIPLLAIFLSITLWGLVGSRNKHHLAGPLYLGVASAVAALSGIFMLIPIHVTGLIAIVAAAVWDIVVLQKYQRTSETIQTGV